MAKAETQAKDAIEVINTLTQENENLKKRAEQAAASIAEKMVKAIAGL